MPVLPTVPPPFGKGVTVSLPDADEVYGRVHKFVAAYKLSAVKAADLVNAIMALRSFVQICQGSERNAEQFLNQRKIARKLLNTSEHFLAALTDWAQFCPEAKDAIANINKQLATAHAAMEIKYPDGRSRGMRTNIDIGPEIFSFMLADAYKMAFAKEPTGSVDMTMKVGKASAFEKFYKKALAALGIERNVAQRTLCKHLQNWRQQRRASPHPSYSTTVVKKR